MTGRHEFVVLIAANAEAAGELLASLKVELETNDTINADFSEVTGPIRALEGIVNRCGGQLVGEDRTHIRWTSREIVLPVVPDSPASGVVVRVAGILGRIRGMQFKRHDGRTARPSLVLIDDPQSDESADSPEQCDKRLRVLAGAILGLAGPGKKISGLMPLTVIFPGDAADRILDAEAHPEWQGERMQLVYAFPTNEVLWAKYAELRNNSLRAGRQGEEATEFYAANRAAMDEGAVVAWKERFNPDELSALQHAMNLKIRNEDAFLAEYQNLPRRPDEGEKTMLTADEIAARLNRLPENLLPLDTLFLTLGIDVHDALLFYVLAGWAGDFTGAVVHYGTYPRQGRPDFTTRKADPALGDVAPGAGREAAILAGLNALTTDLLGREFQKEGGSVLRIGLTLVDHGYLPDVVFQFARRSPYAATILPSRGQGIGAKARPMSEYVAREGERLGWNTITKSATGRAGKHVIFDANAFKSFTHTRLGVAPGDRGALTLFGDRPDRHRLFARHLCGERPVKVTVGGRSVWEWSPVVGAENHYLDALVLATAAASLQGACLPDMQPPPRPKRQMVDYRQLYDAARAAEGRR